MTPLQLHLVYTTVNQLHLIYSVSNFVPGVVLPSQEVNRTADFKWDLSCQSSNQEGSFYDLRN